MLRTDLTVSELLRFPLSADHAGSGFLREARQRLPVSNLIPDLLDQNRASPLPVAGRGNVDDLVDPLVAKGKFLSDLSHRTTRRVEAADAVVEVDARPVDLVLKVQETRARLHHGLERAFV
jgi:hypothetical protein